MNASVFFRMYLTLLTAKVANELANLMWRENDIYSWIYLEMLLYTAKVIQNLIMSELIICAKNVMKTVFKKKTSQMHRLWVKASERAEIHFLPFIHCTWPANFCWAMQVIRPLIW